MLTLADVHTSADEGVVVLRGDFRGTGAQDYVIAGRTKWGSMIVASADESMGAPRLEILVPVVRQSPLSSPDRYTWVPERRQFLLIGDAH